MLTTRGIILVTALCINVIIIGTFCIWCFIQLYRHRKTQFFIKRRPVLVWFELMATLGVNGMGITYTIESLVVAEDLPELVMTITDDIIRSLFSVLSLSFGVTVAVIRMWIFYYDLEISHIKRNQNWQMAIDSDIINNNWFLNIDNQRKYYNNGKYLAKIGFTFDIIHFAVACLLSYYGTPWSVMAIVSFYLIFKAMIAVCIWRKYDSNEFKIIHQDCFDVRKEMKTTVMVLAPYCLIALILWPVSWRLFGYFSITRSLCLLVFLGSATLTWGYLLVPYVIQLQREKFSHISGENNTKKSLNSTWRQTVATNDGYELFMNHLEAEFSVENLLFLTEYIQVKNVIKSKYILIWDKMMNDKSKINEIKFNVRMGSQKDNQNNDDDKRGIPVSKIAKQLSDKLSQFQLNRGVHEEDGDWKGAHEDKKNDDSNDNMRGDDDVDGIRLAQDALFVIKAFETLYTKYIDENNAPFMINIASQTRDNLKYSLDNRYYIRSTTKGRKSIKNWIPDIKDKDVPRLPDINKGIHINTVTPSENKDDDDYNSNVKGCKDAVKCFVAKNYLQQADNDDDNNDESAIEWLLFHLISEMDRAAQEISTLIKDSFIRFAHKRIV